MKAKRSSFPLVVEKVGVETVVLAVVRSVDVFASIAMAPNASGEDRKRQTAVEK
jgi:hypothetical protein